MLFRSEALADDWQLLFTRVLPVLLLQFALFQLAEEVSWMGFLQARLQDRHGPLKASLLVTVPFALWHLPDLFAQVGLATALILLPILAAAHLCARVVFLWLYNATGAIALAAVGLVVATRGRLAYEQKGP